ncbi:MAG: hypothetical protein AAGD01_03275 [Acidobacteriota bacterium]
MKLTRQIPWLSSVSIPCLTVIAILMVAAPALAGEGSCGSVSEAETSSAVEVTDAAATAINAPAVASANQLRVVLDEETGKLRAPTEEESKAWNENWVQPKRQALPVQEAADGTQTVVLGALFAKAAQAEITADGKVEVTHDVLPVIPIPAEAAIEETAEDTTAEATLEEEK